METPIKLLLIAGGKYHDFDFARLELLKLMAEHERLRVQVVDDYEDHGAIEAADVLVSYTCDVQPSPRGLAALKTFLGKGGRWLALHGTNSVLVQREDGRFDAPDTHPQFMEVLGSQFKAHPPICKFQVRVCDDGHELSRGIADFWVEDELYLADCHPGNHVLMTTRYGGNADPFVRNEWPEADHPVLYHRAHAGGEIVYCTLGHCRGKFDVPELIAVYPYIERGAWNTPAYYEILRRALRWAAKL